MLLLVRLVASAIALILVATYYLLASIPFSYYHFLQFPHFWWLPPFIAAHPVVLAAGAAGALPWGRLSGPFAAWRRGICLAAAVIAVWMFALLRVPALQSYELAAALSFAPLLILLAANGLHLALPSDNGARTTAEAGGTPRTVAAGAVTGLLASAIALAVNEPRAIVDLRPDERIAAAAVSVAAHVASFATVALLLAIAGLLSRRHRWASLGPAGVAAITAALLIRRSLLTALILSDLRAAAMALVVGVSVVSTVLAIAARRAPRRTSNGSAAAVPALAVVLCVAVLPPWLQFADWGGSMQKLLAMMAWVGCALVVARAPRRQIRWPLAAVAACALWIAASTIVGARVRTTPSEPRRPLDVSLAVDRYATFDSSLSVLLDVFRPMASDTGFLRQVGAAGDATDNRSLPAVEMHIGDGRVGAHAALPNIFIIVIDSLRPDYLSAYNPAASFTPRIGAFARDSLVMRSAFTAYAGTALSEPAIWAGGLIQRAMYIQPFEAVNNLERLVSGVGYRSYVSVDEILGVMLGGADGVTRLDARLTHPDHRDEMFKFDLCSTLAELTADLDRDLHDRPIFFYSQPQNLHIRVLAGDEYPRDERVRVGGQDFFAPAVKTLSRLDECFGGFIDQLKARHLYDNSIVVLTSDHGDSYGEAGRWGHAFYLAPETIRIPLVVHVPTPYLEGRVVDRDQLAMSIDVTPTLFDLLRETTSGPEAIAGRSLLPRTGRAPSPRDTVLVQSSYSRVYGLLDGRARWLYIADANHAREEFYDLASSDPFPQPVAVPDRPRYRKWILERLQQVAAFYAPGRR